MKALPVLIRQQHIAIAVSAQTLNALRLRLDEIQSELERARAEGAAAQRYLLDQLDGRQEVAVTQLRLAHARLGAHHDLIMQLESRLTQISEQHEAARRLAAQAQKRLEKLEELAARARREQRESANQREWLALDEWVLNTMGRSA